MMKRIENEQLAYHSARLSLGVSFLLHGAVRVPKLNAFASKTAGLFDETLLAGFPALATAYAVPLVEVIAGLMILVGGKLIRWGLAAGILLMGVLMIGTCLLERWEWLVSQLLHLALFYILLLNKHTPGPRIAERTAQPR